MVTLTHLTFFGYVFVGKHMALYMHLLSGFEFTILKFTFEHLDIDSDFSSFSYFQTDSLDEEDNGQAWRPSDETVFVVNTAAVYPTDKASNRALNKDVRGLEDLIDTIITAEINVSGEISINWSPQIGVGVGFGGLAELAG